MTGILSASLENITVQGGKERLVCRRAVHKGMARGIDGATFIRVQNLKGGCQVFR